MKFENLILFPRLTELKYLLGLIDFKEKNDENMSNFNRQKLKTRLLIENYDFILASPVEGKMSCIHIIIPNKYYELKDSLMGCEVNLIGPYPLNNGTYLQCVYNTLTVKLSAVWCRVGKYLVKGEHFLETRKAVEGVQLQPLLTDDCLALSTSALRLKLPLLGLIDLGVDFQVLYEKGFVSVLQKVYILPELKPATAISVHLKLPSSCPFGSYKELKNYWKNLYGYRLPENEDNMLYVEVAFERNNFTYLYPIVCICLHEPIQLKSKNEQQTITQFLVDLKTSIEHKKPKQETKFNKHYIELTVKQDTVFYHSSRLYFASESIKNPNLLLLDSETKGIQDFHTENNQINYNSKTSPKSLPICFPNFRRAPPPKTPTPSDNTFKCFATFKPQFKATVTPFNFYVPKKLKNNKSISREKITLTDIQSTQAKVTAIDREIKMPPCIRDLKKLKLPVLLKFCKDNGIPIRNREKKEIVIQKIYDFFTMRLEKIEENPTNSIRL